MRHVDALNRMHNIMILEEDTFEKNLSIAQNLNLDIQKITNNLLITESKDFELQNGLVYKKMKGKILFYVPKLMEDKVIYHCHDRIGQVDVDKTAEY